jgi:hypothetical protein
MFQRVLHPFARKTIIRALPIHVPLRQQDAAPVSHTKASRRLDKRVKHGLQIERRATDDLEHVSGGGLLLQRVAQFVEQPRVLDGNDGLGSFFSSPLSA